MDGLGGGTHAVLGLHLKHFRYGGWLGLAIFLCFVKGILRLVEMMLLRLSGRGNRRFIVALIDVSQLNLVVHLHLYRRKHRRIYKARAQVRIVRVCALTQLMFLLLLLLGWRRLLWLVIQRATLLAQLQDLLRALEGSWGLRGSLDRLRVGGHHGDGAV